MELICLSLPWMLVILYLTFGFREPGSLPDASPPSGARQGSHPLVSVVVPARNEEENIGTCLESLAASRYPALEILVVDDGSEDRTAEIVRGLASLHPSRIRLIQGRALPPGWFGKPWACWQGADEARGELFLFTDADTVHDPDLLDRSVAELERGDGDVLTVVGQQVMGSFWERLLQPQFFLLLASRYPRAGSPKSPQQWRHAIANGQYLLFRRRVYEAAGGHEAVAGEVVEDLRLAQLLVRGGWTLLVREAQGLRTRMYRDLSGLVEGWSKNVATAALQTTGGWLRPLILPLSFVVGAVLWVLPPVTLAGAALTGSVEPGGTLFGWALLSTVLGVFVWSRASTLMGGSPLYGLLFPLGSAVSIYIFFLSWVRGTRVHWKGRSYRMREESRVLPPSSPESGR